MPQSFSEKMMERTSPIRNRAGKNRQLFAANFDKINIPINKAERYI